MLFIETFLILNVERLNDTEFFFFFSLIIPFSGKEIHIPGNAFASILLMVHRGSCWHRFIRLITVKIFHCYQTLYKISLLLKLEKSYLHQQMNKKNLMSFMYIRKIQTVKQYSAFCGVPHFLAH